MTEILFYHLQGQQIDDVLPSLLERCLARGWRAAVQVKSPGMLASLDDMLWTYRDDSFLPHAKGDDDFCEEQPIVLVDHDSNPNSAQVRFLLDSAQSENMTDYQRVVILFDGNDVEALKHARMTWKALNNASFQLTYWQQNEDGQWQKKSENS